MSIKPSMDNPLPPDFPFPDTVDKLETSVAQTWKRNQWVFFSLSKLLWLLWKLPCMYSADLGRLGPGFGVGAGFGIGIGFGLIGGAGFGFGLPGMQFGLGLGAGFGFGIGFGYGVGKGWAYDERGQHCNLPFFNHRSRIQSTSIWEKLSSPQKTDVCPVDMDEGRALWEQFLHTSKLTFDSIENDSSWKDAKHK